MGHACRGQLLRLLGGHDGGENETGIVNHVVGCSRCWRLAVAALGQLESMGAKIPASSNAVKNLVELLRSQRDRSLAHLGAQGRLAKLKRLTFPKRLDLIRTTAVYRTLAMVDTLLRETETLACSGREESEEFGRLTLALLELLGPEVCPDLLRSDLRAQVWIEVANGRRVRADWRGSEQALKLAQELLRAGTGSPSPVARLRSIRSSLACDVGQTAVAVREAALAQAIYREMEDWTGLARSLLQEANALVETEPSRALGLVEEGLRVTEESEVRLRMYLKSTGLECFIELGRTEEALQALEECRPLYQQFRSEAWVALRVRAIEARLLEALGKLQEAELLYRGVMEEALAEGFARESFMARLMLFNFYFLRGRMDEAAALCAEGAEALEDVEAHPQMRVVSRELKAMTEARRVDSALIKALRLYLAEHWNTPARQVLFLGAPVGPTLTNVDMRGGALPAG